LLELVASGQEVTITSDGKPKAVLSPVDRRPAPKLPFFRSLSLFSAVQPPD
jgi:antitoxin (DNA-binding transcriptional repressor) of toxin-antitoxin stability system